MDFDPVFLSRIQFGWVIALHILLPAFTVGLACYIATLEGLYLASNKSVYLNLSKFWLRIFAVSFGLGVVSGVVMPFQFGTNWSRFSDATANIIGPPLAYEGLTAFFLESGFLGVLLFGRKLVPAWTHFGAAVLVALGTFFSSFWILAVNSWMQTPVGYEMVDGRFLPKSWVDIIFSPSFPYRLTHTVNAFFITTAFVVIGVGAYHLRRGRSFEESRNMLSMTLWLVTVLVPLQIVLGDLHGVNTFEHQPAKLAAMEANWDTQRRMPAIVFAWPDEKAEKNFYELAIPAVGSLYLTHSLDGQVKGLKEWPAEDRPPVPIVFFSFRAMVGIWILMFLIVVVSLWLRWRGRLYDSRGFHLACIWGSPLGFLAVVSGWITTEVGRQPWVVYGLMRTRDGVSPSLTGNDVLASLIAYVIVYLIVFGAGLIIMLRLMRAGPVTEEPQTDDPSLRSNRPLGAVTQSAREPAQ